MSISRIQDKMIRSTSSPCVPRYTLFTRLIGILTDRVERWRRNGSVGPRSPMTNLSNIKGASLRRLSLQMHRGGVKKCPGAGATAYGAVLCVRLVVSIIGEMDGGSTSIAFKRICKKGTCDISYAYQCVDILLQAFYQKCK